MGKDRGEIMATQKGRVKIGYSFCSTANVYVPHLPRELSVSGPKI